LEFDLPGNTPITLAYFISSKSCSAFIVNSFVKLPKTKMMSEELNICRFKFGSLEK
jgi:hypothetical protein